MELRCSGNKLHGIMVSEGSGELEVRCDSKFCGKQPGVVILHRFDLGSGEFHTERYSEPTHTRKEH